MSSRNDGDRKPNNHGHGTRRHFTSATVLIIPSEFRHRFREESLPVVIRVLEQLLEGSETTSMTTQPPKRVMCTWTGKVEIRTVNNGNGDELYVCKEMKCSDDTIQWDCQPASALMLATEKEALRTRPETSGRTADKSKPND